MKLEQLMEGIPFTLVQGSMETEVTDIIYDSRKAAPGLAFVCIVGTQRDSHEFAADCAAKGVSVLVIQHRARRRTSHTAPWQLRAGGGLRSPSRLSPRL